MAHRPTSIPLPTHSDLTATSPIPPTPSAFPSLSGDSPSTHAPQSTLHYAQVTGKSLPPSSIPKGVSLPPPHQQTTSTSKERIQSSGQKNRDSPYARPGSGQRTNSGGQSGGGGAAGAGSTAQRRKSTKPTTSNGQSSTAKPRPSSIKPEEKDAGDKHRNIPGMPPAWVAKNAKKYPPRRKSEGNPPAFDKDGIHVPGKKKIRTLNKSLLPANSKLSASAPVFEFVPRSATTPNLAAAAADHESSSGSASEEESGEDHHNEEEEESREEQDQETTTAPITDSSSLGSFLTSSFSLSDPESLTPIDSQNDDEEEEKKDPAEGLVDEKLAAEIVSSSGPQADGFVGQTLTQSESGMRPDTDKTGFRSIPGVVNESPMADLEWKEKMGWWREDYAPEVEVPQKEESPKAEEKEVKLAPAAVEANSDETPLLQFPPWKPTESSSPSSSKEIEDVDLSNSKVSPSILSKVLPDSFSDPQPVASTSSSSPSPSQTITSDSSPTQTTSDSPSPTPVSLSSFLPTSFTPPLSGYTSTTSSFLSQDELKAEKLSADGPSDEAAEEMPLSAEAVASQPTLDDALNLDEVKGSGSEKPENTGEKEKEKVPRKEWWNSSEGENETEKPQKNQAEHSDSMVDPELAKETVESVPAQADGFVAKGFSEVDRAGEDATQGEKEVKKEVEQTTREEDSHREIVEEEPQQQSESREEETEGSETREGGEEEEEKGSSTPLGSFLSSAFQPTDNSFSSSSPPVAQDEAPEPTIDSTPVPSSSSSSKPAPPARRSSSSPPPPERRPSQSHAADSAPSLTLAISSAWNTAPWSRKIWAIIASVAINVGLPFVNGVMLGKFSILISSSIHDRGLTRL